jgi:transposase InsO family protein
VRKAVVAVARWMALGKRAALETVAARLWVSPRTLRGWCHRWREQEREAGPRGRKPSRGPRERRLAVLAVLSLTGLHVGLPSLRRIFPELSRAELADLKWRMLRVRRRRGRVLGGVLTWTTPGTVWAMDHAHPPGRIDGLFRTMFMVRDLASSNQLDALPCIGETDIETCDRLEGLFLTLGPPLVLKCDNGSAFRSQRMRDLLNEYHVLDLLSPPRTPKYNGAIEAGNGSIKVRAHHEAARHGRPGEWTCDDLEAARLMANELGRPFGMNGPTPDEAWAARRRILDEERTALLVRTAECWLEDCRGRGYLPGVPIGRREADTMYRTALVRALIDKGLLVIGRTRISPPFLPRIPATIP